MSTNPAIVLLESIDASLKALLRLHRESQPKQVASDADLEGPYGDPEIKAKDPKDWCGPSMKGRYFSQCPPEYLDLLASRLDYFAEQAEANNEVSPNTGKPIAPYRRRDAARARGWSRRLRNGWHPSEPAAQDPFADNAVTAAQIPFGGKLADEDEIAF